MLKKRANKHSQSIQIIYW